MGRESIYLLWSPGPRHVKVPVPSPQAGGGGPPQGDDLQSSASNLVCPGARAGPSLPGIGKASHLGESPGRLRPPPPMSSHPSSKQHGTLQTRPMHRF